MAAAAAILVQGALFWAGCAPPPPESEYVLGTVCRVNVFADGKPAVYREIFTRIREIEGMMSVNLPDSDISAVNAAAGTAPVRVNPELLDVLEAALFFARESGGAFDPTVGPLVKLWGIGGDAARVPPEAALAAALPLVNWRDVVIDREAGTVFLRRPGMALDVGGIAKGYAADAAAAILRARGIRRALIDLGGNIYVFGEKAGGDPWRVGVQNPLDERGAALGVLSVPGGVSVVTSGVYERFFEEDGRRYHHILSTRDGCPIDSGLLSVTIVAASSMEADALSTTVFALGWEQGTELLSRRAGSAAVFVFADRTVRCTPGAAEGFVLNSGAFTRGD
jgi:thiamine biosynthesis lipoprotein